MFDSLLKPKFYSKCKACLRLIKRRLDNIQKKRNAVQKFLKKDIIDLLRNGLDYNAYGRAEGLFVEQNMSDCYDLIAKFVECIYTRVGDLTKCRDCPDECKQAIASLIYAAARFSDLPELRELRTLFTEKFGKSLEVYTSKEFIDKWKQHHPSKEMKIHLLHDLAQEFSINWDAKTLEQRLYSPALSHEQEKPIHDAKLQKKSVDDDIKLTSKGNERDVLSQERNKDTSNEWWRVRSSTETKTTTTTTTTTTENSSQNVPKASSSSFEKASEDDEAEFKSPYFSYGPPPPPYMIKKFNNWKTEAPSSERDSNSHEPVVVPKKPIPKSVRRRPLKPPLHENTMTSSKSIDAAKLDILGVDGKKTEKASDPWDEEEEEVVLDGLLMHYSKKQSPYQPGTGKIHTKREYSSFRSFKGTSVPRTDMQTLNGHDRATSLVPEMLRTAGHVHPSLPDYDDFTARLAALRRN